jgi:hypothetical protein
MTEHPLMSPPEPGPKIQRLSQLPDGTVRLSLERALKAAPVLFGHMSDTPDLDTVALGIFDRPAGDLPPGCARDRACPYDDTGIHSRSVMLPLQVASHVGARATDSTEGRLNPETIRYIQAHSATYFASSNWLTHQRREARPGDTRSYGAVVIRVRVGNRALSFTVAVSSAAPPHRDQELAYLVGNAVVADLTASELIVPILPESPTFVLRPPF